MKPHKVRYYLERRDPDFAEKMAEVLCVYRQVRILKKAAAVSKRKPMAIVSYDEKPGIQAVATTAPDLPPKPGVYATFAREHEYKRTTMRENRAKLRLLRGSRIRLHLDQIRPHGLDHRFRSSKSYQAALSSLKVQVSTTECWLKWSMAAN